MRKTLALCLSFITLTAWAASDQEVEKFQAELTQAGTLLKTHFSGFQAAVEATKKPEHQADLKQHAPHGDVEGKHMATAVATALHRPGYLFMQKTAEERKASDYTRSPLYKGISALNKEFEHIENTTPKEHGTPAQRKHFVAQMTEILRKFVSLLKGNPDTLEELLGEE